ncbi:MAG: DUF4352 domain-containing protein [Acidobacteria bacterium]|nr:DUF4352 domain-containing protein [Acidobacteriota bacterium]
MRRIWVAPVALALACGGHRPAQPVFYQMGEKAQVGPLIYNVMDAKWMTQIGDGGEARKPVHRYLLVSFSVVNSGASDRYVPLLHVVGNSGEAVPELSDTAGAPGWIGIVRKVKPAEKLEGTVVFDAEPRRYRLRIAEESEPDWTAFVDLPLRLEEGAPPLPSITDKKTDEPLR